MQTIKVVWDDNEMTFEGDRIQVISKFAKTVDEYYNFVDYDRKNGAFIINHPFNPPESKNGSRYKIIEYIEPTGNEKVIIVSHADIYVMNENGQTVQSSILRSL